MRTSGTSESLTPGTFVCHSCVRSAAPQPLWCCTFLTACCALQILRRSHTEQRVPLPEQDPQQYSGARFCACLCQAAVNTVEAVKSVYAVKQPSRCNTRDTVAWLPILIGLHYLCCVHFHLLSHLPGETPPPSRGPCLAASLRCRLPPAHDGRAWQRARQRRPSRRRPG